MQMLTPDEDKIGYVCNNLAIDECEVTLESTEDSLLHALGCQWKKKCYIGLIMLCY